MEFYFLSSRCRVRLKKLKLFYAASPFVYKQTRKTYTSDVKQTSDGCFIPIFYDKDLFMRHKVPCKKKMAALCL